MSSHAKSFRNDARNEVVRCAADRRPEQLDLKIWDFPASCLTRGDRISRSLDDPYPGQC